MTIWLLAFILLGATAGLNLRFGVIRAAFSFVGILAATLFAGLLGKLLKPLFIHMKFENPVLIWLLPPFVAFVLVLVVFKVAGFFVQRKVNLFYKYKAGDLRLALWERLNTRLGLCVGLLNGTAYLILVSFVIYNVSYWTTQIASSSTEPWSIRWINRMGHDLESTGLAKAARSVITMPDMYYKLANLGGLLAQNPQLNARLSSYPAFLSLGERDDLQHLAQDGTFTNAWEGKAPISRILTDPQFTAVLKNKGLMDTIQKILQSDLGDLTVYLKTGKSPKYDPIKILGRWNFNLTVTVTLLLQSQPNIQPNALRAARTWMAGAYANTTFIAGADGQAFLENLPTLKINPGRAPTTEKNNWQGQWKKNGGQYDVSLHSNNQNKSMTAHVHDDRLRLKFDGDLLVFDREN